MKKKIEINGWSLAANFIDDPNSDQAEEMIFSSKKLAAAFLEAKRKTYTKQGFKPFKRESKFRICYGNVRISIIPRKVQLIGFEKNERGKT